MIGVLDGLLFFFLFALLLWDWLFSFWFGNWFLRGLLLGFWLGLWLWFEMFTLAHNGIFGSVIFTLVLSTTTWLFMSISVYLFTVIIGN